jgi:DNA-directed RNA polymerase II subunit RPB2
MNENLKWNVIQKYFEDNPKCLVKHQIDSFNDFFNYNIKQIFKEKNPIKILKQQNEKTKKFHKRAHLYLAGKTGDKLYYGKPVIFDDNSEHMMFPNEARLRNMTYGISIHYDVDVDIISLDETEKETIESFTLEKIYLGRFPIMLKSDLCVLNKLSKEACFNMGECRNDHGGYFIIQGKEKAIISQEGFGNNMIYVRENVSDIYSHSVEVRSVSEDSSKHIRTTAIYIVTSTPSLKKENIVVNIPNVKKPIPLFIVMRALGVISDKSIIEHCILDIENEKYVELFTPCVYDAGTIFTQHTALNYIKTFIKGKTISHVYDILMNYFLPHIGELNFKSKAYYLGYMVNELLKVYVKEAPPTDRDHFKFKRVEVPGVLVYQLFREYYNLQQQDIFKTIDKEYYFHKGDYEGNFTSLITNNVKNIFKNRIVEEGFRKGFKGNWGSQTNTKRLGAVQDLNRLSFNSFMTHLRKINLPMDASAKIIKPRLLHGSQWGLIDPVDTPDGGNVGLHKHMAILTQISTGYSIQKIINVLVTLNVNYIKELEPLTINNQSKIFINGNWIFVTMIPFDIVNYLLLQRRIGAIPMYTSISYDITRDTIYIYTDSGRLCRPIFYCETLGSVSINKSIQEKILSSNFSWEECVSGFEKKANPEWFLNHKNVYNEKTLYKSIEKATENKAILDILDSSESEMAYISTSESTLKKNSTHLEIHPSLMFGIMGNQVILPEQNPLPRNLFGCGQAKQAVSIYHSNFQNRIDKMGVILNYGQIPVTKSRYFKLIHNEEHPYGENVMVAIMCLNGYNVEDAILINKASVDRGMFRTTYFNMYEDREESLKVKTSSVDSKFLNVTDNNIIGTRPGFDYSYLDEKGLIKENTQMDDKKVLIGKGMSSIDDNTKIRDASTFPKKGQLGYVDKSFITEGEEGFRLAKIRIREERMPAIGDKFCSRCGQKGTIGMVVPEQDMPYLANGMRPDIIVNPHAIPSRMTIGQLVETLTSKIGINYGYFMNCTAFENSGSKHEILGSLLQDAGLHSGGNEVLYDGPTGQQIEADVFFGPTYYMRLKHMVKDKINYRARGPKTAVTRQAVQGRANDGGLRIGEMERDGVIGHGASYFLNESMLERGDNYHMAVCNKTGTIAIYNKEKDLFISPMVDGPIVFNRKGDEFYIQNITKHGKDFSIVQVPYTFKLLMQELLAMNVQMRIITDENIDQLTNLSYNIKSYGLREDDDKKPIVEKLADNGLEVIYETKQDKTYMDGYDTPSDKTTPDSFYDDEDGEDEETLKQGVFPWRKMEINYGPSPEIAYVSVILDDDGEPEDIWAESIPEIPDKYPIGWVHKDVQKYKINENYLVAVLEQKQTPNNWKDSIEEILRTRQTTTMASQNFQQIEENRKQNYTQPPPIPPNRGMDNNQELMTLPPPPPIELEGEPPEFSSPFELKDSLLQPTALNAPDSTEENTKNKEENMGKKTVSIL